MNRDKGQSSINSLTFLVSLLLKAPEKQSRNSDNTTSSSVENVTEHIERYQLSED